MAGLNASTVTGKQPESMAACDHVIMRRAIKRARLRAENIDDGTV